MGSVIMTDAIREKLLGIAPFSTESTVDYTPDLFVDKELPKEFIPIFKVKSLTRAEKTEAQRIKKPDSTSTEEEMREFTRKKVASWVNLYDAGSKDEIAFSSNGDGMASKEVFARIPDNIVGDLLFYIIKISGLITIDKLSLRS